MKNQGRDQHGLLEKKIRERKKNEEERRIKKGRKRNVQ
jgi:hypothetical protein